MNWFTRRNMANLIKVNLAIYFDQRKYGASHEEALMKLLRSRYPLGRGKYDKVMTLWSFAKAAKLRVRELGLGKTTSPSEKDELQELLRCMYIAETRLDEADTLTQSGYTLEFNEKFDELFELMKTE